jgi:cellulose synthase/poly-beta-1,6-N-acetylglucosamine synthase-like glycosyltransferase
MGDERISVLVPTYRRPQDLRRCLTAVGNQSRKPDEVVVVLRRDDLPSRDLLEEFASRLPTLARLEVDAPGQVHALNSGLAVVRGDIVAITDDDAAPRPDWLARIADWFGKDARIGGVGGRDWVHHGERLEDGARPVVGKLQWYGRCIGNHHLGVGEAREVDFLKGANMSYRRRALGSLRFDSLLRGSGAQVHNDLAFSLAVRRRGWKLVYDPAVAVDHYPAARFDEDTRQVISEPAYRNAAFNQALVICEALGPIRAWVFLLWSVCVGTRGAPGLLQVMRLYPADGHDALIKARASLWGTIAGFRAAARRAGYRQVADSC